MQPKKKRGFASLSPERLREVSAIGGKKSRNGGFAKLSPEQRKANASEAAKVRWKKVKEARQDGTAKPEVSG